MPPSDAAEVLRSIPKKTALCSEAKKYDISEEVCNEYLNDDLNKEAFIRLILEAMPTSPPDPTTTSMGARICLPGALDRLHLLCDIDTRCIRRRRLAGQVPRG
jgi:hypothetical protein